MERVAVAEFEPGWVAEVRLRKHHIEDAPLPVERDLNPSSVVFGSIVDKFSNSLSPSNIDDDPIKRQRMEDSIRGDNV